MKWWTGYINEIYIYILFADHLFKFFQSVHPIFFWKYSVGMLLLSITNTVINGSKKNVQQYKYNMPIKKKKNSSEVHTYEYWNIFSIQLIKKKITTYDRIIFCFAIFEFDVGIYLYKYIYIYLTLLVCTRTRRSVCLEHLLLLSPTNRAIALMCSALFYALNTHYTRCNL